MVMRIQLPMDVDDFARVSLALAEEYPGMFCRGVGDGTMVELFVRTESPDPPEPPRDPDDD